MEEEDLQAEFVTHFAQLVADMEQMAASMTSGARKMLPGGWTCAILPVAAERQFQLSLSAPSITPEITSSFPNLVTFDLEDLPSEGGIEEFTTFMRELLDRARSKAEEKMTGQVARKALTQPVVTGAGPRSGSSYEATGQVRGFLSAGVAAMSRPSPAQLEREARQAREDAKAEREAIESIKRVLHEEA